jgi:N-acetylglucosamine-6-sulfatase
MPTPTLKRRLAAGLTVALVLTIAWAGDVGVSHGLAESAPTTTTKPNIVFVMTDDLSADLVPYMPRVQEMIDNGVSFTNYITSNALCCPSRATFMTGKYPHNTGVLSNRWPDGGYGRFAKRDLHESIGGYLQRAGYRTGIMGKFLNQYSPRGHHDGPGGRPGYGKAFVPPGWDQVWITGSGYQHFSYRVTTGTPEQSRVRGYRGHKERNYLTDRLAAEADEFILDASTDDPFFLVVTPFAPHGSSPSDDPERPAGSQFPAAPRDRPDNPYRPQSWGDPEFPAAGDCGVPVTGGCDDVGWPTVPAEVYNHIVVNPVRWAPTEVLPAPRVERLQAKFLERVRMVQAVDDMIAGIEAALVERGVADDTYLVFGSDNGYHLGEHALAQGKATAYDHDVRLPFVVVPPGEVTGRDVDVMASNVDLLPTFGNIAGVTSYIEPIDGRSLLPFVLDPDSAADARTTAYIETFGGKFGPGDPDRPSVRERRLPPFGALRTADFLYVDYTPLDGVLPRRREAEYFDLVKDPYEMINIYDTLSNERRLSLDAARLAYAKCQGTQCWAAGLIEP